MLTFEDFAVGQQFSGERYTISRDQAIGFAEEYDPQYFHTDERAAASGIWGRLVVSGWQTAAITMRLKTTTRLSEIAGGLIGLGIEAIRWPRPVLPGDTLSIVITIVEKRESRSRPSHGVMKYRVETFNQRDELVMEMTTAVLAPKRAA